MKTVTFVRHGMAQANEDGLLAGSKTDSPLTVLGETQAHDLAASLAKEQFDLIVSSPLSRATKTAEIIATDLHYDKPVEVNELLIERDFGSATNMPKAEAFATLDDGTATNVESVEDFGERAKRAIEWLHSLDAEHILVVSHAAFGQMLGTILEGGRPEDFLSYKNLGNTAFYTFKLD